MKLSRYPSIYSDEEKAILQKKKNRMRCFNLSLFHLTRPNSYCKQESIKRFLTVPSIVDTKNDFFYFKLYDISGTRI